MTKEDVKSAISEVLEEERKKFWVDSEMHYQHHEFIGGLCWAVGIAKKSILVAFATGLIAGLMSILWIGFQVVIKVKGALPH